MILSDKEIMDLVDKSEMISPFCDRLISSNEHGKIISYGLSSFGYDVRLRNKLLVVDKNRRSTPIIYPKDMRAFPLRLQEITDDLIIPPNSCALGETVEEFMIPNDVIAICVGKSTYARAGLIVNVTPLEPGWCGTLTLELINTQPSPLMVYQGEGICQLLFFRGSTPDVTYSDRCGKYQNQRGITLSRI